MEVLAREGYFSEPGLNSLEEVLAYGIGLNAGRVFADLWDLDRFSACTLCVDQRKARLQQMNFQQLNFPVSQCPCAE
jgi:hypothetical protein